MQYAKRAYLVNPAPRRVFCLQFLFWKHHKSVKKRFEHVICDVASLNVEMPQKISQKMSHKELPVVTTTWSSHSHSHAWDVEPNCAEDDDE